jgi:hypothetical protein
LKKITGSHHHPLLPNKDHNHLDQHLLLPHLPQKENIIIIILFYLYFSHNLSAFGF